MKKGVHCLLVDPLVLSGGGAGGNQRATPAANPPSIFPLKINHLTKDTALQGVHRAWMTPQNGVPSVALNDRRE